MKASLIARLQAQPDAVHRLLAGLTEAQIRGRPQPDKWSVFENLAHLFRYQEIFRERMVRILAAEHLAFPRYVADEDGGFADWCRKPLKRLLADGQTDRDRLNAWLAQLAPDQLARAARHPAYGLLSVEGWTEFFLLHEAHHLFTLFKLGAAVQPNPTLRF